MSLCQVVSVILDILVTGCGWPLLSKDLLPSSTVYYSALLKIV